MTTIQTSEIQYTSLNLSLCEGVATLFDICFPLMPPEERYSPEDLMFMLSFFAEGTIVAVDGDRVVGAGTGVFLNLDFDNLPPTEADLLHQGYRTSLALGGDYYYGTDMAVHPDYRGYGIARQIYIRRKAVVQRYNKKGFAAAAVLPGFAKYKHEMGIETYMERVLAGEYFDPTLSVQMRNGFKFMGLVHNFFTFPLSDNWGAMILWENPDYQPEKEG